MQTDTLTLSGERLVIPVYDGVMLAPASREHQTMRFQRVPNGYMRSGRIYTTHDPAALARAFRYLDWRATITYWIGPRRYSSTLDGGNLIEDLHI